MNVKLNRKWMRAALAALLVCGLAGVPFSAADAAARSKTDIDQQIAEQQRILDKLNEQKSQENSDRLSGQIADLQAQLESLKDMKKQLESLQEMRQQIADIKERNNGSGYDAQGAINALLEQIADLQEKIEQQESDQGRLTAAIERIGKIMEKQQESERTAPHATASYGGGTLVNPGPQGKVSYTQDAVNSQGNSTMIFRYAPNQLYKIYCRTGYLTDLAFKKGEKVRFVGGGDTSAWAVNSVTVDGTPHIYIKPVVSSSTTNLIVTTDKRSYQLIVCTSDWYNPMVSWTYDGEEHVANLVRQENEETLAAKGYDDLNFNYKVKGSSKNLPTMVFDDGEKTVIKFKRLEKQLPAIFVQEKGRKGVSLVNFKVKENSYVLDRVIDKAEIRFSDKDIVTISREG